MASGFSPLWVSANESEASGFTVDRGSLTTQILNVSACLPGGRQISNREQLTRHFGIEDWSPISNFSPSRDRLQRQSILSYVNDTNKLMSRWSADAQISLCSIKIYGSSCAEYSLSTSHKDSRSRWRRSLHIRGSMGTRGLTGYHLLRKFTYSEIVRAMGLCCVKTVTCPQCDHFGVTSKLEYNI